MDKSEEMDLDSLMELLDDNELMEDTSLPSQSTPGPSTDQSNQNYTKKSERKTTSKVKTLLEHNFLSPKKIINPKEDEMRFNISASGLGEGDSSDDESKEALTKTGKEIKKEITKPLHQSPYKRKIASATTWKSSAKANNASNSGTKLEESFVVDSYSGIRIVNPLVSFSTLQQRMEGRRMVKMSFIQNRLKGGDIEGDWVTIGVVIGKLPPKTSKNGKAYSIWKMSDLHDAEKPVSVFLFGNAHTDHWKTTVGSVIGILNPSVLPDKDKQGQVNLAVDNAGKFMVMGKSKDLGFCKSKRKDGTPCNVAVNVIQCEYCTYHVKNEYKKFSAKRSELQASYSGREPSLKNKVLKGQNVFYAGQTFTALGKKPSNQIKSKDKLTLMNLGLKRKAEVLETAEKGKGVKKLTELYGPDILKAAERNSEFINSQLATPTVGSRNLLQHLMKNKTKKEEAIKIFSPKDLLRLCNDQMTARGLGPLKKDDTAILRDLIPQIGRGLKPGQDVNLAFASPKNNQQDFAKMKAIEKIKQKGPIKKKNPNWTKNTLESADKVKAVLNKSFEESKVLDEKPNVVVKSRLGSLDMNSEKVKEILKRKSSHAYEVEMAEMDKEAAYFNALEKKERMEEKMSSIKEIVCDVVSCKKCKYTAHSATERCKEEQHPLKCHKALKRFFVCKDCKKRTFCFTKLPTQPCRSCGGSNFERTAMMKPRSGPKLDSEVLNIRGDEIKFLNSLAIEKF